MFLRQLPCCRRIHKALQWNYIRESLFILIKDKKTTRKNFKAINLKSF